MDPRRWSLARQLLALQVLLLGLVVALAAVVLFTETRRDTEDRARDRVLTLARGLSVAPDVRRAAVTARPETLLQPYAEDVRRRTGVDFVVFMASDRTRWSHPNPDRIGEPFIGAIAPALAGRSFTETSTGTLGPSVRAVAPVRGSGGQVVGLVAVGVSTEAISRELSRQLPGLVAVTLLAFGVALAGTALVSRRLRRQTHGMGAAQITRLYEYYDAVLHAVREGLLLVDSDGRLQLVNDEARRLLELPGDGSAEVVGQPVRALPLPPSLAEVLSSGRLATDELHLTGRRVLLVNQMPASWEGHRLGTVTTMRDHTELQDLAGELDSVRALTESLRSQAHEAANRMHTVVSLLELGRSADAIEFATAELELSQRLTDQVVGAVDEPVLAATLLGKAAQAAERGVELVITDDTAVPDALALEPRDLVTIVGNLVDNAIDAAADAPPPARVTVTVRHDGGSLLIRVADTGKGLAESQVREAFRRGWSTKPTVTAQGRGLGLALVGQVVYRLGGEIEVSRDVGAVFAVRLPLAAP